MYEADRSFTETLDIAREDFIPILDYLAKLYPSKGSSIPLISFLLPISGSFPNLLTPFLIRFLKKNPLALAQTLSAKIFSRLNAFNERASHSYAVAFPASTVSGPRFPPLSVTLSDFSMPTEVIKDMMASHPLSAQDMDS